MVPFQNVSVLSDPDEFAVHRGVAMEVGINYNLSHPTKMARNTKSWLRFAGRQTMFQPWNNGKYNICTRW